MPRESKRQEKGEGKEKQPQEKIRINIAKLSMGATIKWKRNNKQEEEEQRKDEEEQTGKREKKRYTSRMVRCTRCMTSQQTSWMQLRTVEGYRGLHCKGCGRQERCARSLCQCGVVWHVCPTHREDPPSHSSRKGEKNIRKAKEIT